MTKAMTARVAAKRETILDAATTVFLANGYAASSMDEITSVAGVSKQTVYAYFRTKEVLFTAAVHHATGAVTDHVQQATPALPELGGVARWLQDYAERQLIAVLDPGVVRLRRLTISEAEHFPDLARSLWEQGPERAVAALAGHLGALHDAGHLRIPDPQRAARELNWLIMGEPLNQAMLLGAPTGTRDDLRRHACEAVATFIAVYTAP